MASSNSFTLTLNPLNKNINVSAEHLGLIPYFAREGDAGVVGFRAAFEACYNFGNLYEMTGGTVTSEGTYQYPQDPALIPLALYETINEKCYQYDYGIIAIVSKMGTTPTFVTRMD